MPEAPIGDPASAEYLIELARRLGEFAVSQTGQLDKANDRYAVGKSIVAGCEARDREAVRKSKRWF